MARKPRIVVYPTMAMMPTVIIPRMSPLPARKADPNPQVPTAAIGTDAFQEAPVAAIMGAVAKHVFLVTDAEQLEDLNSYGWVDQQAGIAHIPIDRAMELTVRELSEPPQAD